MLTDIKNSSAVESEMFLLKTLTPLMMHGWQKKKIYPNGKIRNSPLLAEMRVQSFRGVMRYWWRTLQYDVQFNDLLREEKKLFGGIGGEYGIRSPVIFRLSSPIKSKNEVYVLPHRNKGRGKAIKRNEMIRLIMSHQKKDLKFKRVHELYVKYMLCLAGFGQRARRGAGAVQYDEFRWNSVADMQETLRHLLSQLDRDTRFSFPALKEDGGCLIEHRGDMKRIEHPVLRAVWVGRMYSQAEDARTAISRAGHEANSGGKWRTQYLGSENPRLSSPLHGTVRQVGEGYVPIITEVTSKHTDNPKYRDARARFLTVVGVRL